MKRQKISQQFKNQRSCKLEDKNNKYDFRIALKDAYVLDIKNGRKTIEGRLDKGIFKTIRPDATIQFFSNNNTVNIKVKGVKHYKDFHEMLFNEDINRLLPNMCKKEDIDAAITLYRSFPGYKEGEQKYGVLALYLEVFD